jgi:hypothetical protein
LLQPYFDFVVSVDDVPLELLGLVLLGEELLLELPLLESLDPDELGVEEDGEDELLDELGELGVAEEPDALEELGELGEVLLLEESRLELEPDIEPDGEVPEAPLEDPERDAPGLFALSQPYRPVMATASGRAIRAVF